MTFNLDETRIREIAQIEASADCLIGAGGSIATPSPMPTFHPSKLNPLCQDLRQALTQLYGERLIQLILFGSYARQDATADSDIDIMLVLQDTISPGDEILRISALKTALNLKYDELISINPISQQDYQTRLTPFLQNVRREGIVLFSRTTQNYLQERAQRGSLQDLHQILAKVPDIEPEAHDKF
jgi:uncharacterized protein